MYLSPSIANPIPFLGITIILTINLSHLYLSLSLFTRFSLFSIIFTSFFSLFSFSPLPSASLSLYFLPLYLPLLLVFPLSLPISIDLHTILNIISLSFSPSPISQEERLLQNSNYVSIV